MPEKLDVLVNSTGAETLNGLFSENKSKFYFLLKANSVFIKDINCLLNYFHHDLYLKAVKEVEGEPRSFSRAYYFIDPAKRKCQQLLSKQWAPLEMS